MNSDVVQPLELRQLSPRSCSLAVRAQPGARKSGLIGEWNGMLKIAVRAPAEDGRANAELIEVLAVALGLKRKELTLIGGEKQRQKTISIALSSDEARRRLTEFLGAK